MPRGWRELSVPTDLGIQVSVQIDESRSYCCPVGLNLASAFLCDGAKGGDGVAVNSDVALVGWITSTIDNLSVTYHQAVCHVCLFKNEL